MLVVQERALVAERRRSILAAAEQSAQLGREVNRFRRLSALETFQWRRGTMVQREGALTLAWAVWRDRVRTSHASLAGGRTIAQTVHRWRRGQLARAVRTWRAAAAEWARAEEGRERRRADLTLRAMKRMRHTLLHRGFAGWRARVLECALADAKGRERAHAADCLRLHCRRMQNRRLLGVWRSWHKVLRATKLADLNGARAARILLRAFAAWRTSALHRAWRTWLGAFVQSSCRDVAEEQHQQLLEESERRLHELLLASCALRLRRHAQARAFRTWTAHSDSARRHQTLARCVRRFASLVRRHRLAIAWRQLTLYAVKRCVQGEDERRWHAARQASLSRCFRRWNRLKQGRALDRWRAHAMTARRRVVQMDRCVRRWARKRLGRAFTKWGARVASAQLRGVRSALMHHLLEKSQHSHATLALARALSHWRRAAQMEQVTDHHRRAHERASLLMAFVFTAGGIVDGRSQLAVARGFGVWRRATERQRWRRVLMRACDRCDRAALLLALCHWRASLARRLSAADRLRLHACRWRHRQIARALLTWTKFTRAASLAHGAQRRAKSRFAAICSVYGRSKRHRALRGAWWRWLDFANRLEASRQSRAATQQAKLTGLQRAAKLLFSGADSRSKARALATWASNTLKQRHTRALEAARDERQRAAARLAAGAIRRMQAARVAAAWSQLREFVLALIRVEALKSQACRRLSRIAMVEGKRLQSALQRWQRAVLTARAWESARATQLLSAVTPIFVRSAFRVAAAWRCWHRATTAAAAAAVLKSLACTRLSRVGAAVGKRSRRLRLQSALQRWQRAETTARAWESARATRLLSAAMPVCVRSALGVAAAWHRWHRVTLVSSADERLAEEREFAANRLIGQVTHVQLTLTRVRVSAGLRILWMKLRSHIFALLSHRFRAWRRAVWYTNVDSVLKTMKVQQAHIMSDFNSSFGEKGGGGGAFTLWP